MAQTQKMYLGGVSVIQNYFGENPIVITSNLQYPALTIEYLVVAGGGSGGNNYGGGGGAGGLITGSYSIQPYETLATQVGNGGAAVGGTNIGINGYSSRLGTFVTASGGGGGGRTQYSNSSGSAIGSANSGGSGGGGGGARSAATNYGLGLDSELHGYNGGNGGSQASNGTGAGGGGASQKGQDGENTAGGLGGRGGSGSMWLDGNFYAGGGGGCTFGTQAVPPLGGPGGGGKGTSTTVSTAGTANTGGGGGSNSQAGGSGVIKIRYSGTTPLADGGDITIDSGYTYHTFTYSAGVTGSFIYSPNY